MKKLITILGVILSIGSLAFMLVARYAIAQKEFELNQKRTEKARETRLQNLNNKEVQTENENEKIAG